MKFKEEVCGNCGFDLTTVEPVRVRDIPIGDEDEMVPHAPCPKCNTNRIVVAPELAISPDPEPEPRGGRRRAPEPEPEAPAEEAPAEEPGPEE